MKIIEIEALYNGAHRNQTIEIEALYNGAHRNQTIDGEISLPNGWAVIPEDMECENFPFGNITVEVIDGIPTMTEWEPLPIPEPEEPEEPEVTGDVSWGAMAEAITEGVNDV